jgi:protein tyrosine/serine phosphatase
MHSLHRAVPAVAVLLILLSLSASAQDATTYAELPRFQQVSEKLYRSGQPRAGGLVRLRELGINTIINLRGTSNTTRAEEAEARSLGFKYFNVALPNWGRPQDTRVERILAIIAAPENGKVLVHCKEGVDRTGMIVAIYRMALQGWSRNEALVEAERSGMRRIQFWMRDYVKDYGDRVAKLGPETALKAPTSGDDFDDHIGEGMRIVERETFRARKVTSRFLRKFSASLH